MASSLFAFAGISNLLCYSVRIPALRIHSRAGNLISLFLIVCRILTSFLLFLHWIVPLLPTSRADLRSANDFVATVFDITKLIWQGYNLWISAV